VVLACVALIPDQELWAFGLEVLIGTAGAGVIAVLAARAIVQDDTRGALHRYDAGHIISFVLPLVVYLAGGLLLVVALATIIALIGAVVFSWVALVEILR